MARDNPYDKGPPEEKRVHPVQAKKNLEGLFQPKAGDLCAASGHSWVRDFDGREKCHRCKVLREPKRPAKP